MVSKQLRYLVKLAIAAHEFCSVRHRADPQGRACREALPGHRRKDPSIARMELAEQRRDVTFDSSNRDDEALGDFCVRKTLRQRIENLGFAS
jgi:hypothetical protein